MERAHDNVPDAGDARNGTREGAIVRCVVEDGRLRELPEPTPLLSAVVYWNLYRKSNQRQIVLDRETGKRRSIKSPMARNYFAVFSLSMTPQARNLACEEDLVLSATVYYANRQSDLSVELLCDALQDSGVVRNDNCIRGYRDVYAFVDRRNPRVHFSLYRAKDVPEYVAIDRANPAPTAARRRTPKAASATRRGAPRLRQGGE